MHTQETETCEIVMNWDHLVEEVVVEGMGQVPPFETAEVKQGNEAYWD